MTYISFRRLLTRTLKLITKLSYTISSHEMSYVQIWRLHIWCGRHEWLIDFSFFLYHMTSSFFFTFSPAVPQTNKSSVIEQRQQSATQHQPVSCSRSVIIYEYFCHSVFTWNQFCQLWKLQFQQLIRLPFLWIFTQFSDWNFPKSPKSLFNDS